MATDPEGRQPADETTTSTGAARPTRRRPIVAVVAAVAGLAVGAAVGFAAGWQVQKQRVEDDLSHVRPVGVIVAVADDSVTVRTGGERREYRVSEQTVVDTASVGSAADLARGATVIVRTGRTDDGDLLAREIVVLPEGSTWTN